MIASTAPQNGKTQKVLNTTQLLGLVTELGFFIAVPLAILAFGGAFLDKSLSTSPLFLLLGMVLALCTSTYAVWMRIRPFLS